MSLKFLLFSLMLGLMGFEMVLGQDKSKEDFKLYLLPPRIKSENLSKLNINKIKPVGKPFLTTDDFRYYFKDTHELTVDFRAAERLKKLKVPVSGRPFIVFVGNKPIYPGAFWTSFSSISFKGIVINVTDLKGDFPVIKLELDYPTKTPKNDVSDSRSDERIFKAFEKAGILYEEVWLHGQCKNIRATGKRRQSYVFTLAITSVVKRTFKNTEIQLELYTDWLGFKLLKMVEAQWDGTTYAEKNWRFNSQKTILLKFYQQVGKENPDYFIKDFEEIN